MSLYEELKRRNVFRVGAAYAVVSWLLIQVAETIFPLFGFGDAPARVVVVTLAIGFVPALILSWIFEWTPDGLRKERDVERSGLIDPRSGKRLDRVIILGLTLALIYFAVDEFVLDPQREARLAERQKIDMQRAREEGRSKALIESYGDASIAVLAFENMSSDQEQEYFADGVSEEILNLLAAIPELRVISRSSAFTYKGRELPIPQIARELNVAHVLEGSVRKAGNQVRVTAQLIEGSADRHLWSKTWDRTLDDIFAIQDEIAADVVSQLRISLVGALPRTRRTDTEVYTLTLKARRLNDVAQSSADLAEIQELLSRALAIDPTYVPALEVNIPVDRRLMLSGLISREEADRRYRETRARILGADPDNAVVARHDAWNLYEQEGDVVAAAATYDSLLSSHPNDAEVLRFAGGFLRRIGKFEESVSVLKRCELVDPLKAVCSWELKETLLWAGKLEASRDYAERLNAFWNREAGINDIYRTLLEGHPVEARKLANSLPASFQRDILLTLAAHDLSDQAAVEWHRDAALAHRPDKAFEPEWLVGLAGLFAYMGDSDQAFKYLDRATAADEFSARLNLFSPWLAPLREDPRWRSHRQRIGLSEELLAAIEFSIPEHFPRVD